MIRTIGQNRAGTFCGLAILTLIFAVSCAPSAYDLIGYYAGNIPATGGTTQSVQLQLASNNSYLMRVETFDPASHVRMYTGTWELRDGVLSLLMDGAKDWRFSVDREYILLQTLPAEYEKMPPDALSLRHLSK